MNEMNPVYRYQKLWLAIGYGLIVLVIYLSVSSHPPLPDVEIPFFDKIGHVSAYFVMMAWFSQIYHVKKQRFIYALIFIVLGVAMEFLQSLDPARMFEVADMVANTAGVVLALLISGNSTFSRLLLRVESHI